MTSLSLIRRLWAHAVWADKLVLDALADAAHAPPVAWREYAHVLGAESVWLARLEMRMPAIAVWPELPREEIFALREAVVAGYERYLTHSDDASLKRTIDYVTSAGQPFSNTPAEILAHVVLHGQYHRGKINLLLRNGGVTPAPVDYISFVRGVPAAVTELARPS